MLVAVAMAASLHSYWIYHTPMEPDIRIGSTLLFVVVNGCFAAAAWLNATSAVERLDKRMGDLTYALYLCDMPLIWLIWSRHLGGRCLLGDSRGDKCQESGYSWISWREGP